MPHTGMAHEPTREEENSKDDILHVLKKSLFSYSFGHLVPRHVLEAEKKKKLYFIILTTWAQNK